MKKLMIKITIGLLICLSTSISHAYTFNDVIGDRIGNIIFEIYGMNVTQTDSSIIFDIFTNYRDPFTVGGWTTLPADFAIDVGGDSKYEYGVAFRDHTAMDNTSIKKGDLYLIDTTLNETKHKTNGWYITDHYEPVGGGYGYWHDKPVGIAGGTDIGDVSVTWYDPIGTDPNYRINFTLDKNDFLPPNYNGSVNFFTASATCANDYMDGMIVGVTNVIPEPASMLLFGIGVLGFGFVRRKR